LVQFAKQKFSRIDLLVNNAAIAPRERNDILAATRESFDELINTNLKGPHFLTQAVANLMLAHGSGRIVFEIQPGIIRTGMISKVESIYDEKIANGLLPQRRMGETSDIAKALRSIAEGHLDYCAGQRLNVDGGFHMRTL